MGDTGTGTSPKAAGRAAAPAAAAVNRGRLRRWLLRTVVTSMALKDVQRGGGGFSDGGAGAGEVDLRITLKLCTLFDLCKLCVISKGMSVYSAAVERKEDIRAFAALRTRRG